MKKIIVTFLMILILAGAGIPYVKGMILEQTIRQSMERINRSFTERDQDFSVAIVQYEKQYADSTIEWHLDVGEYESVLGVDKIVFMEHVDHGYSKIISTTSLEKNAWFRNFIDRHLDGNNPLTITTAYSLTKGTASEISLSGFAFVKDSKEIQVRPGSVKIEVNKDVDNIISTMAWQGMGIQDMVKVSGLRASAEANKLSALIWAGTSSFRLDTVFLKDADKTIEVESFKAGYGLAYEETSSTISMDLDLAVDRFVADRIQAGSGALRMQILHLDANGFEEVIRLNRGVPAGFFERIVKAGKNPGEVSKVLGAQMQKTGLQIAENCEKFLRKGLEINVPVFHVKIPQGEIAATLFLGLRKQMTLAGFLGIMMQPSLISDIFSLKSDVKIPYELTGYQPLLLSPLYPGMKTGVFVVQGSDLIHRAEIREDKLIVNREEILLE